jgi:hypothetical protein
VLTFHQGIWALLHAAGLMPPAPYPTDPVPPLGVPRIVNFCFPDYAETSASLSRR